MASAASEVASSSVPAPLALLQPPPPPLSHASGAAAMASAASAASSSSVPAPPPMQQQPPHAGASTSLSAPFVVRATSAYTAAAVGDLSFPLGALLLVIERDASGWWTGRYGEAVGILPSNHIEQLDAAQRLAAVRARARALHNQDSAGADAGELLGTVAGETILLLEAPSNEGDCVLALRERDGAAGYVRAAGVSVEP
jgi:hypothetical protein